MSFLPAIMLSICWKLMQLQQDKKNVNCLICKLQLSYSHRSTTNLMRHLKSIHPLELEAVETAQKQARAASKDSPSASALLFPKPETSEHVHPTNYSSGIGEGHKLQSQTQSASRIWMSMSSTLLSWTCKY